ncbi:glycosyltransferase family 2 protein [Shimia sp. R9_1]|uniref:glycosyltransferase family 2 protein n=1 Tax=Shimia sp. R9_1 TaxID=2821111 RepID=UPI001ADB708D|nr:glycosyltransferase [Shimia sp. R9_1]MBO9407304.1 glycosyltransferase family 2 protein [Shimia sp. R9_1]
MKPQLLKKLQYPEFSADKVSTLFFRSNGSLDAKENVIKLSSGRVLTSNTIFNSLDCSFLRNHTGVKTLGLEIEARGKFKVEVLSTEGPRAEQGKIVFSKQIDLPQLQTLDLGTSLNLWDLDSEVFLRVTALEDNSAFSSASFTTAQEPVREQLKINCVICTYNREEYIQDILRAIEDNPEIFNSHYHFTIVDNGQNLKFENSDLVTIIPNKNTGGSGGFTRGMLETSKGDFTHMVLMDDDIKFQVSMFRDLVSYLRYTNEKTVLGSGMVRLDDDMRFLHERGASLQEGFLALSRTKSRNRDGHAYDAAFLKDTATHAPWWWACFPIEALEDVGFSYPFFIKLDDAEYSFRLRRKGYSVVFPGGFYIWHSPMEEKYSAKIGYYGHRNSWIFSTLNGHEYNVNQFCKDYLRAVASFIADAKYEHADVLHKALTDFLKGPDFIASNAIAINAELGTLVQNEAFKKVDISNLEEAQISNSKLARAVRRLTLNGFLANGRGEAFVDLLKKQPKTCKFLKRRLTYYNPIFGVGYTVERSLTKTISKSIRALWDLIRIKRSLSSALTSFETTKDHYVSAEYWERLLADDK